MVDEEVMPMLVKVARVGVIKAYIDICSGIRILPRHRIFIVFIVICSL